MIVEYGLWVEKKIIKNGDMMWSQIEKRHIHPDLKKN